LKTISYSPPGFFTQLIPLSTSRNSQYFQDCFKSLIRKHFDKHEETDQEGWFLDPKDPTPVCKTLVLALDIHAPRIASRFRSYSSKMHPEQLEIPIWQVALAAVSNPHDMIPFHVTGRGFSGHYIEAGIMGYSNPSREAFSEAADIWTSESIKYVLSIGCGTPPQTTVPSKLSSSIPSVAHLALVKFLHTVSSDTERVTVDMKRDAASGRFNFTRWSVDDGLHMIHSSAWTASSHDEIEAKTRFYLTLEHVREGLRGWSHILTAQGTVSKQLRATHKRLTTASLPRLEIISSTVSSSSEPPFFEGSIASNLKSGEDEELSLSPFEGKTKDENDHISVLFDSLTINPQR
jgi:hypothetical protein